MKKYLNRCWPAVFVATLSCVAHAQSSVTLYGVLDSSIQYARTGGHSVAQVDSANVFPSQFGLQGVEDLGGGYKAIFKLESGINVSNGASAQTGKLFGREAWVGLSSPYGRVQIGLNSSPEMWGLMRFEAGDLGHWDWGHAANNYNFFVTVIGIPNSVVYYSPNISGFTFSAMYGLGSNGVATEPTAFGRIGELGVNYENGPFAFELDLESVVYSTASALTASSPTETGNHDLLGLSYNFGFAKLDGVAVLHRGAASVKAVDYATYADPNNFYYDISVQVPNVFHGMIIADFGQYYLQGNSKGNSTSYGLRYDYRLSKRTGVYAGVAMIRNSSEASFTENPAQGEGIPVSPGKNLLTTVVGMTHAF